MKEEVLQLSRQHIKLIFLDNFNLAGKDKMTYFELVSGMHFPKLIFSFLVDKYEFYTVFSIDMCLNFVTL